MQLLHLVLQLHVDKEKAQIFDELNSFIKKYKISPNLGNTADATFNEAEKNSPFANFNPEFAILEGDTIEIMFRRGKDRFPLNSFGTGIQQLLYILTALYTSNGPDHFDRGTRTQSFSKVST